MKAAALLLCTAILAAAEARPPRNEADLKFWLGNMARHDYSVAEIQAAMGLASNEITARLPIASARAPPWRCCLTPVAATRGSASWTAR